MHNEVSAEVRIPEIKVSSCDTETRMLADMHCATKERLDCVFFSLLMFQALPTVDNRK